MRVIVVSAEPLFLDGLVALFHSRAEVIASTNIRESVRAAALDPDSAVVVDSRTVSERDLDYLVGAREFGSFQVYVISEPDAQIDKALGIAISNQSRGVDLVAAILGQAKLAAEPVAARRGRPRIDRSSKPVKSPTTAVAKRGRPRLSTNSLPLAPRQYELARLIGEGRTNGTIAEIMGLREQTVKNMVRTIAERLGCSNRKDIAVQMANH